ncbi:MAG TPA: phenylacetate--CoA ligase [Methanocorpusculum sp.]|nr:phenylacetate--CoA ligase [Candidatus Methanocorpusculum faecipullorum]HJK05058.1 phenylacetate--CoA ligase [Methanocorpusculum sp.]HJK10759.1 phenylacetate--CoA ligase [Methanocorpusculum sp.]HJK40893.1 phenylacetate--CoA ligase [Methanocorpusculum sp.]HJK65869.1 phenylacetate--CoA ligase [Methanocorpusculum sp.]
MFWNEKMETLRGKELQELQLKRLKETVARTQNIGFYQKMFAEAGIRPEDIKTLDDLSKIPFTKKSDLRGGYPFGFLAVPMNRINRIHTTSGTTGKPTVVAYTKNDLNSWSELIARNLTMVGLREGDMFQNASNYSLFTGGLGFHYGAEKIGCAVVPAGVGNTKRQIEMIQDFGVNAIHCTPSYAMHLTEVAEDMHANLESLRIGVFGAEAWSENMRRDLENRLNIKAYDSYGMSELFGPGVAFECPEQDGLHIWHDCYIVEIIDPKTGETLGPGEKGEMVVTPLVKEAMPLLRYRTGDITMLMEDDCPCGRGQKIARLFGRSDDMLTVRGINVFPSQIEHVLKNIPEVGDQFMVYIDRLNHLDEMTIEVEINKHLFSGELSDLARLQNKIGKALHETLTLRANVQLVEPGSLPRFEGKAKRVVDRRKI